MGARRPAGQRWAGPGSADPHGPRPAVAVGGAGCWNRAGRTPADAAPTGRTTARAALAVAAGRAGRSSAGPYGHRRRGRFWAYAGDLRPAGAAWARAGGSASPRAPRRAGRPARPPGVGRATVWPAARARRARRPPRRPGQFGAQARIGGGRAAGHLRLRSCWCCWWSCGCRGGRHGAGVRRSGSGSSRAAARLRRPAGREQAAARWRRAAAARPGRGRRAGAGSRLDRSPPADSAQRRPTRP